MWIRLQVIMKTQYRLKVYIQYRIYNSCFALQGEPCLWHPPLGIDGSRRAKRSPRTLQNRQFVHDADKAARVFEDTEDHEQVGGVLCRFRNLKTEPESANNWTFFESIRQFLPDSGRFCEVFNLWVAPDFRRQGLATRLKRQLEIESHRRDIEMIYTHTERTNPHVIELNLKLGYREIRRGPIWDEIERVSLTMDFM